MTSEYINAIGFAVAFWCLNNTLGCSLISDLERVRKASLQGTSLSVHLPSVPLCGSWLVS